MACELWGPSFPEEERSCSIQPDWQHGFYFDMIEETALNEKSCVQVMRILLTKADAEIDELEKDLVFLQSELVWDEHEEWSDISCNALRAKINCLDISIRKLGNKDENDFEVCLLMHEEPAEELHKVIKAQLKSFLHGKNEQNEQSQDVAVLDSRSSSPEQLATLHKSQKSSISNTCFTAEEESNGPGVIPKENCTSSNPSTELEVEKANSSETLKEANVKDLIPLSLLPAADQFDKKEVVTILDLETVKKGGIKECGLTLIDKNVILHSSPKSAQKRMYNPDRTNIKEPAARFVNNSNLDVSKHSAGCLNKKIKLNASSLNIVSEEATVQTSISAADRVTLDSPSNPMGKGADISKKVKVGQPANTIAKDLGSIAHEQTTSHSNEMKNLSNGDLKVNGCEVQGCYTTTTGESKISNSCFNPEHEENFQKADKRTSSVVKTISPDTLRHAAGLNGEENNSDSRLGAFVQAESLKIDMEQKLCDFAAKSLRKRGFKELKVASSDKKGTSNSLFKGEGKKKDSLQVVKQEKADLNDNEHSALTTPLIGLQDEKGKDKTIQNMERNPKLEEVQMAEIAVSDDKLVMNLYKRPQKGKVKTVKTNLELTSASVEEPCLKSWEKFSNSASFSKGNRLWKDANNHSLNYFLSGKIIKNTVLHSQCEAEERSMMLDSRNTMPLPQKKCKKVSSVPTAVKSKGSSVQMNISKMHGELNRSTTKTEIAKSEASVDDSCTKGLALMPFDASNLMKLKLRDLRYIAKARKLTKYSALTKKDLINRLENQFSS